MHPVYIGKEDITIWDNKAPFLKDDVIGQLLCAHTLSIDEKGFIFQIQYDHKLFHDQTKEIVFNTKAECIYDLERDNITPTLEEITLVFEKGYQFFKNEFDRRKVGTNLESVNFVPFDPQMESIKRTSESIQDYIEKKG